MPSLPQPSKLIKCDNLSSCLQNLYNLLFAIFVGLAFLYFLYGAFEYLLSGSGIYKRDSGVNKMKNSIIALIIVLVIPIILNMINPGIFKAQLQIPHVIINPVELILNQPYSFTTGPGPKQFIQLKFGEILPLAQKAANKYGIDTAFLLAIFNKETSLGKGVGNCKIDKPVEIVSVSGRKEKGVRLKTFQGKKDGFMKESDFKNFKNIVEKLNRDLYNTPVSCGSPWGGAMGYLQVMPSTWKHLGYRDPWNIKEALFAAAEYLAETCGAKKNEELAAVCYYAGPGGMKNPERYKFYSKKVMAFKKIFQEKIKELEKLEKK